MADYQAWVFKCRPAASFAFLLQHLRASMQSRCANATGSALRNRCTAFPNVVRFQKTGSLNSLLSSLYASLNAHVLAMLT
jgi:hypothetical protein